MHISWDNFAQYLLRDRQSNYILLFTSNPSTDRDDFAETCRIRVSKYLNGYRKSIACKGNVYFQQWQAYALCRLKKTTDLISTPNENNTWAHVISTNIGIISTLIVLSVSVRTDRNAKFIDISAEKVEAPVEKLYQPSTS